VENRKKKKLQGMQVYLNEQRAVLADWINHAWYRKSALVNLAWKLGDNALKNRIARAEAEYLRDEKNTPKIDSTLISFGTRFPWDNDELALTRIAEFWRCSSEMLHGIAKGYGRPYYHFLQPNQYVEDSKPMGAEERKITFLEGTPIVHPYPEFATLGYPYLITQAKLFAASEVPVYDLAMMFRQNEEVL
jgi:hypothetical protein